MRVYMRVDIGVDQDKTNNSYRTYAFDIEDVYFPLTKNCHKVWPDGVA